MGTSRVGRLAAQRCECFVTGRMHPTLTGSTRGAYKIDFFAAKRTPERNMRYLTRILLVLILLLPILWVWPQRGSTVKFYRNRSWVGPAVVHVERQINLDFMTAASASLPQQEFSVEWSGWLRTDRDGQYAFDLRSDDGSTLELDGRLVVDAGGVRFPTSRTATIAMTRGLHQIRLRFVQTDGAYEFYAYWTPP